MTSHLIRWALNNRLSIILISLVVLLTGMYMAATMPVDVFPDLTRPDGHDPGRGT